MQESSLPTTAKPVAHINAQGHILLDLTLSADQLKLESKPLGRGYFGEVYAAKWGSKSVAVKKLLQHSLTDKEKECFQKEAATMFQVSTMSDYVVRLYKITVQPYYSLVMELMPNGNLHDFLRNNQDKPLSREMIFRIAMDIASGLSDIHAHGIIHCDLKSLNVLLDHQLRAKLSDFGLVSVRRNSTQSGASRIKGTPQWMSPEVVKGDSPSEASDIYSLGMIFWEVATRRTPYSHLGDPNQIMFQIFQGKKEKIPDDCDKDFQTLISACWSEVAKRPKAVQIVDTLKPLLETKARGPSSSIGLSESYGPPLMSISIESGLSQQAFAPSIADPLSMSPDAPALLVPPPKSAEQSISASHNPPLMSVSMGSGLSQQAFAPSIVAPLSMSPDVPALLIPPPKPAEQSNIDVLVSHNLSSIRGSLGSGLPLQPSTHSFSGPLPLMSKPPVASGSSVSPPKFAERSGSGVSTSHNPSSGRGLPQLPSTLSFYDPLFMDEPGVAGISPPSGKPAIAAGSSAVGKPAVVASSQSSDKPSVVASTPSFGKPAVAVSSQPSSKPAVATSGLLSGKPATASSSPPLRSSAIGASSSSPSDKPTLAASSSLSGKPAVATNSPPPKPVEQKKLPQQDLRVEDEFQAGEKHYQLHQYSAAFKVWEKGAQNHIFALLRLGCLYEHGWGVKQDVAQAAQLWSKLKQHMPTLTAVAESGQAEAQYFLGLCYAYGAGVEKDQAKALIWYRRAADQGYASAQNNLGTCYKNGLGIGINLPEAFRYYRFAAEQGHTGAQINLGLCYEKGRGVTKDVQEAELQYSLAAVQGNESAIANLQRLTAGLSQQPSPPQGVSASGGIDPAFAKMSLSQPSKPAEQKKPLTRKSWPGEEDFQAGEKCYKVIQFKAAFALFRKAAERDHPLALLRLGLLYDRGQGVTKDPSQAKQIWSKLGKFISQLTALSAEDNAEAQCNLGECYLYGAGVTKDEREGMRYLHLAAAQKHADAQFLLAFYYFTGRGVTKDVYQGVHYCRLAADQGNAAAQCNMGVVYLTGGNGVEKDEREAVRYFRLAAVQEHAAGQYQLGQCYWFGWGGLAQDKQEAVRYFRQAAKQGDALAQVHLGLAYTTAEGVARQDHSEAVTWFTMAAAQGHPEAQYRLGTFYHFGFGGLEKSEHESVRFFRQAAAQGHAAAQFSMGWMYEGGNSVLVKDVDEAVRLYRLAAAQGYEQASAAIMRLQQLLASQASVAGHHSSFFGGSAASKPDAKSGQSMGPGDGGPNLMTYLNSQGKYW